MQNGLVYQTICINHPHFDAIFIHSNVYILKTMGSFNFVPASHDDPQFNNMSIEKMTSEHGVMNGNDDVSQEDGEYLQLYDDVIDIICKFQTCPHWVVISLYLITFIFILFSCVYKDFSNYNEQSNVPGKSDEGHSPDKQISSVGTMELSRAQNNDSLQAAAHDTHNEISPINPSVSVHPSTPRINECKKNLSLHLSVEEKTRKQKLFNLLVMM
jgi:hypothetical protein